MVRRGRLAVVRSGRRAVVPVLCSVAAGPDPPPVRSPRVDLLVVLASFPVVFVGELPDKTMLASLVLATRGRPLAVWLGAAGAFAVHVAIAVTLGVAVERLLPHRATEALVAAVFAAGAAVALWPRRGEGDRIDAAGEDPGVLRRAPGLGPLPAAFVVIFVAEWGDLTQVLTAGLAARTHAPLSVAVGAVAALWAVAALAVVGGRLLVRVVSVGTVRRATGVIMLGLAAYSAWAAAG